MSGEDLYNLWAEAMEAQSVEVDDWHDLSGWDRAAWDATAKQVRPI